MIIQEYQIKGQYMGNKGTEIIDTADNKTEAYKLLNEYKQAFGESWSLRVQKVFKKERNKK